MSIDFVLAELDVQILLQFEILLLVFVKLLRLNWNDASMSEAHKHGDMGLDC